MIMEKSTMTLASVMANIAPATICNVVFWSEPSMNKTNNPYYGRVVKVSSKTCQFGFNYENAVNNRIEKVGGERTFITGRLPWGKWVVPNKIIENKGKLYGRFYEMKNGEEREEFYLDGVKMDRGEVEDMRRFLIGASNCAKQSREGLIENQVRPFNVNLDNIINLRVDGVEVASMAYAIR